MTGPAGFDEPCTIGGTFVLGDTTAAPEMIGGVNGFAAFTTTGVFAVTGTDDGTFATRGATTFGVTGATGATGFESID